MPEKSPRLEDSIYALLICLAVYAVAIWQIRAYQSGLDKQTILIPGDPTIPAISFGARGSPNQPAVIIAHGLSASKEMMQTLSLEVARLGVAVYLFDFPGHGSSVAPFRFDPTAGAFDPTAGAGSFVPQDRLQTVPPGEEAALRNTDRLVAYLERVYNYVREQHGGDTARVALVGHSMGSGVATRFAMEHPEVKAVIVISPPFPGEVSQSRPPNLLLLVGQWDIPQSVAGVRKALAAATDGHAELGMTYGDFSSGTARRAVLLPRLDHVAIVFSPAAAVEINHWLARALQVLYAVPTGIVRLLWLLAANLAAIAAGLLLVSPLHHLVSKLTGMTNPAVVPWPREGIEKRLPHPSLRSAQGQAPGAETGPRLRPFQGRPEALPEGTGLRASFPIHSREQGVVVAQPADLSHETLPERWRISLGDALGYLILFAVASGLAILFLSLRTPFTFLRLLIGDYLTSYFFVAGTLMFVIARLAHRDIPLLPRRSAQAGSFQIHRQTLRGILVSVVLFALLFLALGLLGSYTWIRFTPTTDRWARFIPVSLLILPFFLADETVFRALQESSLAGSGVMSLVGKGVVLASLAASVLLSPRNFVVILMLPLMLLFFVLCQLFSLRLYHVTRSSLATATFNALLVAWVMVAVFPVT